MLINTFPCEATKLALNVQAALRRAGLHVIQSFDLQSACAPERHPCPHHGTKPCPCRLIILLAYDWNHQPYSLAIHGSDGVSHMTLVKTPNRTQDASFKEFLLRILEAELAPLVE